MWNKPKIVIAFQENTTAIDGKLNACLTEQSVEYNGNISKESLNLYICRIVFTVERKNRRTQCIQIGELTHSRWGCD
jgi:hypothetical protein